MVAVAGTVGTFQTSFQAIVVGSGACLHGQAIR